MIEKEFPKVSGIQSIIDNIYKITVDEEIDQLIYSILSLLFILSMKKFLMALSNIIWLLFLL